MLLCLLFFFFFQAEDGIRDLTVTGVQTCALPIWIWTTPPMAHVPYRLELPPGTTSTRSMESGTRPQLIHPPKPSLSGDRKSTRLNSSHSQISYAVFCLKKKKTHIV